MDSAADSETPMGSDPQPECEVASVVGGKRPLENGGTEELGAGSAKKVNIGNGGMRRVAEIVLVLSTMAGMRGGRNPTETELNLMTEARAKLVEICRDLAPKDLVVKDAIGTLIEDLGLNWKLKDQRLGFRGSRLSIKDKFSLANMKMEESKKCNATPTYTSQVSQPSFGANTEIRGPSHTIRMYQSDKPSNPSLTSGGLPNSALGHVSAANSTSIPPHMLNTDVRASNVSTGIANSHPVDKAQLKVGGGSNGTNYAPQVQANALGNQPLVNAPAWSLHSHSISSIKNSHESKVNYNAGKPDGAADSGLSRAATQATNQVFRPFIPQSTSTNSPSVHQTMQGVKYVQTSPFFNNHSEIAKIVQKLLQPELPQHPPWIPPSREYMYKPLPCQMCHSMMNEVESVVVCDACEKGFHLKCLETINQKGIPRGGEWHCIRCTTLSNGKPLPPKYGRVMRSAIPVKGASNSAGAQTTLEKKSEAVDQKVSQHILTANGSSVAQDPTVFGTASNNDAKPASDSKVLDAKEMAANSMTPAVKGLDQGSSAENASDNSIKSLDAVSDFPSVGLASESSNKQPQVSESHVKEDKPVSEPDLQSPSIPLEITNDELGNSKPSNSLEDIGQTVVSNSCEVPLETNQDSAKVEDSDNKKEHNDHATISDVRQSEPNVTNANAVGSSEANEQDSNHTGISSDGSHNVKWIGDAHKVADGKTFYGACFIKGMTYKVHDHALFCSGSDKFIPSKLQAMWEDMESGSKWVAAAQCYFPGDLPEAVGHPCAPENNEVYESNHENTMMASLIQGPCEVLPLTKFEERRNRLGTEGIKELPSVFLCKWFYDGSKGSFQPVIG